MNDSITPTPTAAPASGTAEKTAWWITFTVLTLAIVTMLSLWD
jgi:hypothetical protein